MESSSTYRDIDTEEEEQRRRTSRYSLAPGWIAVIVIGVVLFLVAVGMVIYTHYSISRFEKNNRVRGEREIADAWNELELSRAQQNFREFDMAAMQSEVDSLYEQVETCRDKLQSESAKTVDLTKELEACQVASQTCNASLELESARAEELAKQVFLHQQEADAVVQLQEKLDACTAQLQEDDMLLREIAQDLEAMKNMGRSRVVIES